MGANVAVVEDDDSVRELVTRILSERGYDVSVYSGFQEAKTALIEAPPDLLITDVELPDGCGLDLVGAVRDASGRNVPTIILSSRTAEHDFVRGFAAGAVDYLGKPFRREELLARCAVHLARTGAQDSSDANLPE